MRRFKTWLLERFLPAWAKDTVYQENKALRNKLAKQEQEIRELNAYIDGMETAMRRHRISIQIEQGVSHEHMERTE